MRHVVLAVFLVAATVQASAMVGGSSEVSDAPNQPEVMFVGSGGNFCTGTAIGRDLILTAAHCIHRGDTYKLVEARPDRQPVLKDVATIAVHPQFDLKTMLAHRATADVALLKLGQPRGGLTAPLAPARERVTIGERFSVRGYGVAVREQGASAGRLREATLAATGRPGNLQLRLIDPATGGARPGRGACTGDSGAPVYQRMASGYLAMMGVVSWSTGPSDESGCGGITGVTPLELYSKWIGEQANKMGSAIGR